MSRYFRYLLKLRNGESAEPEGFVSDQEQWRAGDVFSPEDGSRWRIVAIDPV